MFKLNFIYCCSKCRFIEQKIKQKDAQKTLYFFLGRKLQNSLSPLHK